MKSIQPILAILSLISVYAFAPDAWPTPQPSRLDGSTYGNIEEVSTEHLALDITVDFDKKQFRG